jgi:endonuclease G, mitochondrial
MRINYSIIVGSVIIFFPALTFSQVTDTITICHKYYTTTFSKSKHFPVVVKYWLTKAILDCEHRFKRKNKFKPDPFIPEYTNLDKDYKKSGYDRGHQMDAYDCGCDSTAMIESFYYSNVAPQEPTLNRGIWKKLEEYTRKLAKKYDSILVWCGSVTIEDRHIGRVAIPDYCWKVLYIRKINKVVSYSFRNDGPRLTDLHSYEVSLDSIHHLSKLIFSKQ